MKDFLGQEIEVGDLVIYMLPGRYSPSLVFADILHVEKGKFIRYQRRGAKKPNRSMKPKSMVVLKADTPLYEQAILEMMKND